MTVSRQKIVEHLRKGVGALQDLILLLEAQELDQWPRPDRPGVHLEAVKVLRRHRDGLRLCELTRKLESKGLLTRTSSPSANVAMAIRAHPELFFKDGQVWKARKGVEVPG